MVIARARCYVRLMRGTDDQNHFSPQVVASSRLVLIGLGTVFAGALIDRAIYQRSRRGEDLAGLVMYSAARRTLATAGAVMVALGVRDLIISERLSHTPGR